MAGLVQRQVEQPDQRDEPHQGDLHPAIEQHQQRGQQGQFEGGQVTEVGALPLHDVLQPRHRHQLDRIDQSQGSVRGDHRRGQGRQAEQPPAPHDLQPVGLRLHQGFGGEGTDQHQAEQETAVQIGPQDHHRQQPKGRGPILLTGVHQLHGPERQDRQHQQMRAGEPALGGAGQRQHQGAGPAQGLQPPRQLLAQDPGERADGEAEQQHKSRPAARPPDRRHDDLRQPFQIGPRLAAHGVGEGIGLGDLVMVEHPAAGGQVPEGVAVPQEARREARRREGAERAEYHHQSCGAGRPGAGRPRRRLGALGRIAEIARHGARKGLGSGHP